MPRLNPNELLKVEELGRRIASSNPTASRARNFFERAQDAFVQLYKYYTNLDVIAGAHCAVKGNDASFYALQLMKTAEMPFVSAQAVWEKNSYGLRDRAVKELSLASEACKVFYGKACTWLSEEEWARSVTAFVNDLTAVLHRLIEGAIEFIETRCPKVNLAIANPPRYFLDLACSFGYAEVTADRLGLYHPADFQETTSMVYRDRVDFVVGDTPGHRTVVTNTAIDYFDLDEDVNKTMAILLGKIGASAKVYPEGVKAQHVNTNPIKLGTVIAMATSMDFRVEAYSEFLSLPDRELTEETIATYWPFTGNVPVRLILKKIQEARRKRLRGPKAYALIEEALASRVITVVAPKIR